MEEAQKTITPTPHQLWRLPEVQRVTGLSASTIYDGAARGSFPKPLKLGPRASAWVAAEVQEWIQARIQEREAV